MHLQSHHITRENIVNQAKHVQATTIHRCCNYTHCLKGAVISKTLCPAHSGQLHSRRVSIKIFTGTEILVKWKDPSDKFPHYSLHHMKMSIPGTQEEVNHFPVSSYIPIVLFCLLYNHIVFQKLCADGYKKELRRFL